MQGSFGIIKLTLGANRKQGTDCQLISMQEFPGTAARGRQESAQMALSGGNGFFCTDPGT